MPLTPIQPAALTKFYRPGITKILWVPTIANTASPTNIELNAGTDLSSQIAETSGWTVSTNFIETPTMDVRYAGQLPGKITAADSSLTLYADKLGVDTRTLMARDTIGYIVWADGGLTGTPKGDIFQVQVATVAPQRTLSEEAAKLMFSYAILKQPNENVTLPLT